MSLAFHQFQNGMTVMDGRQTVATARPTGNGSNSGWILSLRAASWLDARARYGGIFSGKYRNLMLVKTRHEAAIIMIQLTNTGRNPN